MSSAEFTRKLAEYQVMANATGAETIRFVTHMDVNREACAHALRAVEAICA